MKTRLITMSLVLKIRLMKILYSIFYRNVIEVAVPNIIRGCIFLVAASFR